MYRHRTLGRRDVENLGGTGVGSGVEDRDVARTEQEMGDDIQGTDEVFKLLGKDRTIWGAMGYIYVCSCGNEIENLSFPSF